MSMLLFRKGMSGSRRRMSVVFNSLATWVCPPTTTRIVSMEGAGSAGTPGASASASTYCGSVTFVNGVYPEGLTIGNLGWTNLRENAELNGAGRLNVQGGGGGFYRFEITQYSHWSFGDTYQRTSTLITVDNFIMGTAYMTYESFPSSGPIANSGTAILNYSYAIPATNGVASTAFGITFAGGIGGPATTGGQYDFPVIPGQSYPIKVPPGGWVNLIYYE